jgi:hypothetical protein
MIYLSILIVTLESRKEQFLSLEQELNRQIEENNLQDEVEILSFSDNFDYPVGMKRNELLSTAEGLFSAFIDDDDEVSNDYVISIVNAIKNNPSIDCVGIKGKLISKDLGDKEFIHSIKYDKYSEDENYYYRPPNHLNPIRTEIAKQFKFPVVNRSEDYSWSLQLVVSKLLVTEVFLDKVLYYYYFEWSKTEAQRIRGL